jgi:hypothetical protein
LRQTAFGARRKTKKGFCNLEIKDSKILQYVDKDNLLKKVTDDCGRG